MAKCWYCYKEVEFGHGWNGDPNVHRWCNDEWDRRERAKLCVFCAKPLDAEALRMNDIKHERCRKTQRHVGYGR